MTRRERRNIRRGHTSVYHSLNAFRMGRLEQKDDRHHVPCPGPIVEAFDVDTADGETSSDSSPCSGTGGVPAPCLGHRAHDEAANPTESGSDSDQMPELVSSSDGSCPAVDLRPMDDSSGETDFSDA